MAKKTKEDSLPSEPPAEPANVKNSREPNRVLLTGIWMLSLSLVLLAVYLGWRSQSTQASAQGLTPTQTPQVDLPASSPSQASAVLPDYFKGVPVEAIFRRTNIHTNIPTRSRTDVIEYSVAPGDSVFGIAKSFNLHPETILWANYDQLNDSPDMLNPGMQLNVPPVDGVYYQWQEGDTLESVAAKFEATAQDILDWEGNNFDLTNPQVAPDQYVMVPNGHREFRQWLVPTIARAHSGVSKSVLGPGAS
jgi:LysM repeat protein